MVDQSVTPSLLRLMADTIEKNEELQKKNKELQEAVASGDSNKSREIQLTEMTKKNDNGDKDLKAERKSDV